jgi:hypothetical protein
MYSYSLHNKNGGYKKMSSRRALMAIQPPIQWVPGDLSQAVKMPGVKLTTNLQPVPRPRKRVYTSAPHTSSWRSA